MASRQLGKSTLIACVIAHALTFFPGIKVVMFNMDMTAGIENVAKVKFALQHLPEWMRFIPNNCSTKTYIQLTNDSAVSVVYPSTIKTPAQLARSLTIPCLYVDEAAFIRNIDQIWMSAQPTLSTASEQAIKYGYPTWSIMSSTPNGTTGIGQFFYDYWMNAINSDEIFEIDTFATKENETNNNLIFEKIRKDADEIMKTPGSNRFIKVHYHWSEDPRKDEAWYAEQCASQNFNKRKIAQEYDIEFTGGSNNPFDDEVLEKLEESVLPPKEHLNLPHSTRLKIYKKIDPYDYYLIGVDTASSIDNCYSAIEVYSFKNFEQVAELAIRLGSLKQYGEIVLAVAEHFNKKTNGRFILCIENNSIGKSIVEDVVMSDYIYYLYHEKDKIDKKGIVTEWGISTNARTKPLMVAEAYYWINNYPQNIHSKELVDQLKSLERNNSGQVSSRSYTDMFMSTCFCAYARKMKELEILPQLQYNYEKIEEENVEAMKTLIKAISPANYAHERLIEKEWETISGTKMENNGDDEEEDNFFEDKKIIDLPFFFK